MRSTPAVLLLLLVLGCRREVDYVGVGNVVTIDEPRLHVTIEHEDIPGLMGAMTMRFAVASPAVLAGVERGTHVRFVVRERDGELVVTHIAPGASQ